MQQSIVITGASSGIGAALAQEYAARGVVLGLLGRNTERLAEVAASCEARGAQVRFAAVDVVDAQAMADWLVAFDREYPVTLLVANAGVSGGSGGGGDNEAIITRRIFATNVDGVLNTVLPLIPHMVKRRTGQIALVSSLAGMRGLPSAPSYSASKAAVRYYGEALRGKLGKSGVKVNVICPGYVRTPLTAVNRFPMPFIMEPPVAARIIRRGLARNVPRIAFPLRLYLPLWLLSCMSPWLTDGFFARLPEKD